MPGWASPARPAVYKPPVGARVASPQNPILRWSTPRVSALDWATSGLSKSPLLIARPLLLTTNCPLLLAPRQIILWLLGLVTSYTMGGVIHVLLVIALVMIVANLDRKSTRLNSSHLGISYAVFC